MILINVFNGDLSHERKIIREIEIQNFDGIIILYTINNLKYEKFRKMANTLNMH